MSNEVSLPKYETNGSSGMDLAANINSSINISLRKDYYYQFSFKRKIKSFNRKTRGTRKVIAQYP